MIIKIFGYKPNTIENINKNAEELCITIGDLTGAKLVLYFYFLISN